MNVEQCKTGNKVSQRAPFDVGYDARQVGQPRENNPYPLGGSDYCEWAEGWDLMDKIHRLPASIE